MKKKAFVEKERCVACGACTNVCPRKAIFVDKGIFAIVKSDICIGCGLCSRICPAGTISIKEISDE